jgi:site-specific recombinase XerD
LLAIHSNQERNESLKEMAGICEINKNHSMNVAHLFLRYKYFSNGFPIETVSKMLKHTSQKTTQIYAKFVDSKNFS